MHAVPAGESSAGARPVPPALVPAWPPRVPALGQCSVGRGSRASPCLAGSRMVASQRCHPPRQAEQWPIPILWSEGSPAEIECQVGINPGNLLWLQAALAARAGAAGQSPRRDGAWGRDWKRKNLLENQPCSNGEASLTSGALQSRTPPATTLWVSFQSLERVLCSAASAGSWEGPEGASCSRIPGLAMGGTRRLCAPYMFILQKL